MRCSPKQSLKPELGRRSSVREGVQGAGSSRGHSAAGTGCGSERVILRETGIQPPGDPPGHHAARSPTLLPWEGREGLPFGHLLH